MNFERLIFVSGQGATDPATGELAGADVETQTEQCLKNLQAILKAGGSDLQHVLRCGVFLLDMKEFQLMNGVYARVFGDHRPARTTIQAAGLPGRRTCASRSTVLPTSLSPRDQSPRQNLPRWLTPYNRTMTQTNRRLVAVVALLVCAAAGRPGQ